MECDAPLSGRLRRKAVRLLDYNLEHASKLSVAPMMDWTDRHCRMLHRCLSKESLLYTEMITSAALVRGGAVHLLAFDPAEHPVALQLGGSDPAELACAAKLGAQEGYAEINLNVGCPSDRVQSGAFGAVLMEKPALVADCVAAMRAAAGEQLRERAPQIVIIRTSGDKIQDRRLADIGGKALFTKEIERALVDDEIDRMIAATALRDSRLP